MSRTEYFSQKLSTVIVDANISNVHVHSYKRELVALMMMMSEMVLYDLLCLNSRNAFVTIELLIIPAHSGTAIN